MAHHGRQPDVATLPPLVTSPAILVAWDYVPRQPPTGAVCEFAEGAPSLVLINLPGDVPRQVRPEIQPLTVTFDRARIRELLAPNQSTMSGFDGLPCSIPRACARLRLSAGYRPPGARTRRGRARWRRGRQSTPDDIALWTRGPAPPMIGPP